MTETYQAYISLLSKLYNIVNSINNPELQPLLDYMTHSAMAAQEETNWLGADLHSIATRLSELEYFPKDELKKAYGVVLEIADLLEPLDDMEVERARMIAEKYEDL